MTLRNIVLAIFFLRRIVAVARIKTDVQCGWRDFAVHRSLFSQCQPIAKRFCRWGHLWGQRQLRLKQGPCECLPNYVAGCNYRISTYLVWPTRNGDVGCQAQAQVFGQIFSVWQHIMSTVRSSGECVTYDNLDAIYCFSFIYSVYSYFLCCHLVNVADYKVILF